jgi:3-keto-5-aminohexanoate cleavage enzyme
MARKVIITVATTGAFHGKSANPALPEQPHEIAQAAYDCCNAGASIIHMHVRDKSGKHTCDVNTLREANGLVRAKCDIIIQNSTAPRVVEMSDEKYPIAPEDEGLSALDAGPEMCSLDIAVLNVNFGKIHFMNVWTRDWIRKACKAMNEKGIRPEFELFAPTSVEDFRNILVKEGIAKPPYSCTLVMGMKVSQGAIDYTPENLMFMRSQLPPQTNWTVMGIGSNQLEANTMGLITGGNVRVGFEDNIFYRYGELAKSNAQLVERAARMIREFGYDVASPEEARAIVGLPPLKK